MALFCRAPVAVTADRGYGEAGVDEQLRALGVKTVVIPRKGRANAERRKLQSSKGLLKLDKWRTGSEGRISHLKHSWGWNRTLVDGIDGERTWCGWGVLAHNATKIAALIDEREHDRRAPQPTASETCRPPPTATIVA